MSKLYVANTTMQVQSLVYRVPGARGERTQVIPAGEQVQISGDLGSDEIASIVEQQAPYGMFAAAAVGQARSHVSMLYAVGAPVKTAQMKQALERNLFLMGERGKDLRAAAGVATSQLMQAVKPDKFNGAEVTIEEVSRDGAARTIDEHVVVSSKPTFIEKATGRSGGHSPTPSRRSRRAA